MADLVARLTRAATPDDGDTSLLANVRRLVVRTVSDVFDDRVPGMAAEMAFYAVLSLPPLLLVMFGSVGFVLSGLPEQDLVVVQDAILNGLSVLLSAETVDQVLAEPVARLLRDGQTDLLSLGIVLTLWSASRSTNVLLRTLIIAYDVKDHRTPWRRRLLAMGLTLAGVALAVVVLPLLVVGPHVAGEVLNFVGAGDAVFARYWPAVYWMIVGGIGLVALTWVYHVAPGWYTPWRRDLPGAVLAVILLLAASAAIRFYTSELATFTSGDTFRGLAAPVVLLLWVYASGIAVLLGAELNAEIEQLWPSSEGPYEGTQPRHGEVNPRDVLLSHIAEQQAAPDDPDHDDSDQE